MRRNAALYLQPVVRAVVLAGTVSFALVACGRSEPTTTTAVPAPSPEPPPAAAAAGRPASPQSDDPADALAADETSAVGVIDAVDVDAGTVTITHEPIRALGWPAMTMPFKVSNPALLQGIEPGEKVEFQLKGTDMASVLVTGLAAAD
jgi:Cu(I)/Ag(I) efflux system protein CusF